LNPVPEEKPALPLEELAITPEWVRAPAKSYEHHTGEDRGGRGPREDRQPPRDNRPRRMDNERREGRSGNVPPARREGRPDRRPPRQERRPRDSRQGFPPKQPVAAPVEVSFFPEEAGFGSMIEAMKRVPRAYALFDVARLILNKPERHIVRLARKPAQDGSPVPLFLVLPSENPFLTQDDAVRFLWRSHANMIRKETRKPIDPPKGNFAFVNKCGFTGDLLGPPNYHGYQTQLVKHHRQRLANVPFDKFKARIQTVRDPEAVKRWVEQMSSVLEYECLLCQPAEASPAAATQAPSPPPPVTAAVPAPQAGEQAAPQPPTPPSQSVPATPIDPPAARLGKFKDRDELDNHFLQTHLDKLVTAAAELKIGGQASRRVENHAIQEAIRIAWETERKYPLNTANGIRGRLRKEGFYFFKHNKGVTYISIAKPKRLESLAGLTEQVQKIVAFVRANQDCHVKQMVDTLLALASVSSASTSAVMEVPPEEARKKLETSLLADLHWLLTEGYVVEFSDGHLWAPEEKPAAPPETVKSTDATETQAGPQSVVGPKIGVIHYNFPGLSFADFLKVAAEAGYGHVELQLPDVWGNDVSDPEQNAERVRAQVESHGLKVSALAAHNDFVQLDEAAIQPQIERMKRVCQLARVLGTNVIRTEGGQPKDGVPQEKWLDAMYGCFARCIPFLEETNVGLAIDNHGLVTNDGDLLHALLKKINHRLVGTNLDTMNYRWFGHDLATCNRFYSMMAPFALHTHLKDGFGSRENYRGAALGEGEIDLAHALKCLRDAGYQGVYCAEYEGLELEGSVGYRKCAAWLKKCLSAKRRSTSST